MSHKDINNKLKLIMVPDLSQQCFQEGRKGNNRIGSPTLDRSVGPFVEIVAMLASTSSLSFVRLNRVTWRERETMRQRKA